jgi:CheY-like chemotaxis protein
MTDTTDSGFAFDILIVEDEAKWRTPMVKSLEDADISWRFHVETSDHTDDAKEKISKRHFHLISIDQNMPQQKDMQITKDHGISFHKECLDGLHATKLIVYTGYGTAEIGNDIGRQGTRYILKSISGKDTADDSTLSAEGWGRHVHDFLTKNYIPFALERGGKWLPMAMAERSRRALDDLENGRHEGYVRRIIDLWDTTLHLSAALTAALCRAAGLRLNTPAPRTLAEIEALLKTNWPLLKQTGWAGPWPRFIGKGAENGSAVGRKFLDKASTPIRNLRNQLAHTYSNEGWLAKASEIDRHTPYLLDALAFWMETPLVIDPCFHPTQRNRITGRRLSGDSYPLPTWQDDMPSQSAIDPSQVFVPWPTPEGSLRLLPLSPFLSTETDRATGRRNLLLLTNDAGPSRWNYRSLDSGKTEARTLSREDLAAVESVFKVRRGP